MKKTRAPLIMYRVEHKTLPSSHSHVFNEGMYQGRARKLLVINQGENHPAPREDGLTYVDWCSDYYFGFRSKAQLMKWLPLSEKKAPQRGTQSCRFNVQG